MFGAETPGVGAFETMITLLAAAAATAAVIGWTIMRLRFAVAPQILTVIAGAGVLTGVAGIIAAEVIGRGWLALGCGAAAGAGVVMARRMLPVRHEYGTSADGSLYRYAEEDRMIIDTARVRGWVYGTAVCVAVVAVLAGVNSLRAFAESPVASANAALLCAAAAGHGARILAAEARMKIGEARALRALRHS